jgi:hypothetical protein
VPAYAQQGYAPQPGSTAPRRKSIGIQAGSRIRLPLFPLVGAAAVVVGALIDWTRGGVANGNAFDIPLKFLWDINNPGNGFKIGVALVILAAAGAVLSIFPLTGTLTRIAALACLVICVLYGIEFGRLLDDRGQSFGDLFDYLGVGVYVSLGGSILMALR